MSMRKILIAAIALCPGLVHLQAEALDGDTIRRDSLVDVLVTPQPTDDSYRVVTNRFWANWFVLADIGGHFFSGDFCKMGDFGDRLSPDFKVGIGKWFTPGIGAKVQFGMSNSKSYTRVRTHFIDGEAMTDADGNTYWRTKNKWWDLNVNAMFNLSRLICGYEGKESEDLKNQFIASVGIGALHHRDIEAQRNEWSGHFELQYSRFFNAKKAVSLDLKAYTTLYQTNFDGITKMDNGESWWDSNTGIAIGMTYYIKKRHWDRCIPCQTPIYVDNPVVVTKCPEYRNFVFYVFFPNNYSGRDDAPVVPGSEVNTIDYLAAGIFTQKRFADEEAVASRLERGGELKALAVENVPTEKADECTSQGMPRGYEMSVRPISLSMEADSLAAFEERFGYYYAPIYDGGKTWYYRVDDDTKTQSLMYSDNYKESESYGLNAHRGLKTVAEHVPLEQVTNIFSFADVYAAIEGNEGYISQHADAETVERIKHILNSGTIINVKAEGLATSQDNYTGENAEEVGEERNKTLAHYRAYSIIKWLKESKAFKDVSEGHFTLNALTNPIGIVNDTSVRGLNAKMNRCVKVEVQYMIEE